MSGRLAGLGVLVTRPAHQADGLCRLIEEAGGRALGLPLLSIEPAADPAAAAAELDAARGADWWIFTSANAVREAIRLDNGAWPRLAAAGAATAEALRAVGHAPALVPADSDGTPGLLAAPELAAPTGQRILIVTGADTLPGLGQTLRQRGAQVEIAVVYRRMPQWHSSAAVEAALAAADVAIVSSSEALQQLFHLASPPLRARLLDLQLALPSARVVEKARELGFARTPLLPARVSDSAWLELLQRWRLDAP
jgi:uroporphyrinogen-III synthase